MIHNSFKAELREVALELFAERGFDLVSFADIAFAAGISEKLMHRYFREKEDILLKGFCENAAVFRKSLMTMPRTMAPVDAFQLAVSSETIPLISFERILAIMIHSEKSTTLRGLVNDRRRLWESEVATAIADWFGGSPAIDFGPDFWASAIFNAIIFVLRGQAGTAGLRAQFYDPLKMIETAFENLRLMTTHAPRSPSGRANAGAPALAHLARTPERPAIAMASE